ncbi:T9SS type A sorting domain-containing protein [Flavobacterium sp. LPB0248]|uniref:T9SS-dependent choice-of-anchor J family protein n=1 Tax=Flavobacterium sp. LPB0248 TaxID=2614441 RepID=UPI0015A7191B|nr:choice-of-anchor J domain-containing protein [Flavobacterium sp. LPB0248]QLC67721.1 T9SS type A sorting domain-containing protein [Flavobacterium sp. LPB0248]
MKKLYFSRHVLALLCFFCLFSGNLFAQITIRTSLPIREEFNDLNGGTSVVYPIGFQGWTAGNTNGSGVTDYVTSGVIIADKPLTAGGKANSGTGNVYNYDGKIGFLNSGSNDYAIGLAFSTEQKASIEIQYDALVIRNPYGTVSGSTTSSRINEFALQYRVGTTADFVTLSDTYFRNNTTPRMDETTLPQSSHITVMLPAECNNQPVVQVRWISKQISGGGSRPAFAIDNIDVKVFSDLDAPINVTGYPKVTNILADSFDFISKINEKGKTYYVLLPNGSATPTIAQIKAGQNAEGTSALQSGFLDITDPTQEYVKSFAGLNLNTTYSVFSVSEDFYNNIQIAVSKLDATTAIAPVLSTTIASLDLGASEANYDSKVLSYQVGATDLTQDVVLTASANFTISKDNATFGSSITFALADFASNATPTVYVKFNPTSVGSFTGSITHETTGGTTKIVSLSGSGTNPYIQGFNDPNVLTNSGWSQYNEAGPLNKWSHTILSRNVNSGTGAVLINGFSENGASKDWLISPRLRLDGFTQIPLLSFYSRQYYDGPALKLMVSTNYDGVSDPNTATWTPINGRFPQDTGSYVKSEYINLSAYKTDHTYLAWVYETTSGGLDNAAEWSFDDFAIIDESKYVDSNPRLDFADVSPNSVSASQTFVFAAAGYGDITIEAPTSYQLSLDNISFSSSIIIAASDALTGKTVYARFAPTTKEPTISGVLNITGTSLSKQIGSFTGTSILKADTYDVVSYNLEFFGSDARDRTGKEFGPTNDALQIENVAKVMNKLNADVYVVQEVSDEPALDALIQKISINGKTFDKTISTSWSYSFKPLDPYFPPQKLVVIYNTQTTTVKNTKVLFKDLYDQILAHTVVLPSYPGTDTPELNDDSFFSSGRLPYLVQVEANIGGIKKEINLIDLHARANSGTDISKYNQRKYDIDYLKDALDAEYPDANLILLGDFNDDVKAWVGNASTASSYKKFVDDTTNYNALTWDISQAGAYSFLSSQGFLDHILISNELNDDYITNSIAVYDPRNDIANYITTTSDHGPVIARFQLKQDVLSTPDFGAKNKYFVKAYPNPATDVLSFDIKTATQGRDLKIRLYDFNGRAIGNPINVKNESEVSTAVVAVGNLVSGVYFYTVTENNKVIFKDKIIKK